MSPDPRADLLRAGAQAVHSLGCYDCPNCSGVDDTDRDIAADVIRAVRPLIIADNVGGLAETVAMLKAHQAERNRLAQMIKRQAFSDRDSP